MTFYIFARSIERANFLYLYLVFLCSSGGSFLCFTAHLIMFCAKYLCF